MAWPDRGGCYGFGSYVVESLVAPFRSAIVHNVITCEARLTNTFVFIFP
jgi:hypothetical protein